MMSGWHFLRNDGTTEHRRLRPLPGETLRYEGPLPMVVCYRGLHYCPHALEALDYAIGSLVECVEAVGEVVRGTGINADKYVTSARKCLWIADATSTLHEFACWCAERVLRWLDATGRKPGEQFLAAIAAKRAWLRGELTGEQLADAVRAAKAFVDETANSDGFTWDIAYYTWDAVWNASSHEISSYVAARVSAKSAALAMTEGVAFGAVWDAERDAQRQQLDEMLMALTPASAPAAV